MKRALLALLLAWPAQAQQPLCTDHQDLFPALIGGPPEAALTALSGLPGIRSVRITGPNTPMTRDFRPDRATIILEDGVVRSITCG
ncbi:hypothetical protein ACQW02_09000 [Humitalea sp. 24SJ18S-53]|uniref:hypothetical protein n=1 Tax=Humitalea sp. 24SJ18S-53 TaxID=3422307 RepID=UPI003D67C957